MCIDGGSVKGRDFESACIEKMHMHMQLIREYRTA